MIAFIDDHRGGLGVEPICGHPPIAPSTCYDHLARRDGGQRSEIQRVFEADFRVCGVRKVWRRMRR